MEEEEERRMMEDEQRITETMNEAAQKRRSVKGCEVARKRFSWEMMAAVAKFEKDWRKSVMD